jgi:hypothetical protein
VKDSTLKVRLAEILGSIPGFAWSADEDYPSDVIGVFVGSIPDAPDRAVGIRLYGDGGGDDPDVTERKAQAWVRGARGERLSADDIADAVFDRFDKLSREGGILRTSRESMSDMGADANDRERRSENYLITLDNEEALQ